MPTSLPYALLPYQCRNTCPQMATTQGIGSQAQVPCLSEALGFCLSLSRPSLYHLSPLPSFLLGIPASGGGSYRPGL